MPMKCRGEDIMSKVASLVLALLLGLGLTVDSLIAAPAQADPNAKARKEYAVLDKALKANGWKAKADALQAFIQAHPDSQYKDYAQKQALAAQQQWVVELYQKKDMATLGRASEQLLRMQPGRRKRTGRSSGGLLRHQELRQGGQVRGAALRQEAHTGHCRGLGRLLRQAEGRQ